MFIFIPDFIVPEIDPGNRTSKFDMPTLGDKQRLFLLLLLFGFHF